MRWNKWSIVNIFYSILNCIAVDLSTIIHSNKSGKLQIKWKVYCNKSKSNSKEIQQTSRHSTHLFNWWRILSDSWWKLFKMKSWNRSEKEKNSKKKTICSFLFSISFIVDDDSVDMKLVFFYGYIVRCSVVDLLFETKPDTLISAVNH